MNKNLLHLQRWFTLNNSSTKKKKKTKELSLDSKVSIIVTFVVVTKL